MEAEKRSWEAVGVMSGSSLDGLDLAWCSFQLEKGIWSFNIREAHTVPYTPAFRQRLLQAMDGSALEAARLNRDLGILIGGSVRELLAGATVDLIASHGHTLYHKPEEGLTTQLGCGANIAAVSGMPTVCDFRSKDVALGGQGAPLVPLGERLLFPAYKAFLNIGGICNIGLHGAKGILGYDVCIGNQALDFLAQEAGLAYDAGGALAQSGNLHGALLGTLHALPFHQQQPPRSLGREWFDAAVKPLIADARIPVADRLRSTVEHIAVQLARALEPADGPVLMTGGGAHNSFLVERLKALAKVPVEVPEPKLVDFKEALVFALLGMLRMQGKATAMAAVTGAKADSVCGALHLPN